VGTGSYGDKRKTSASVGGRRWKPVTAVGICAALTAILAPSGASASPLGEVVEGSKAAVEEVVSTVAPPAVTSPAVPPLSSPPASTPQPPMKTPPASVPPAPEATPSPPKPLPAVKPPSLPSLPHVPHGSGPDLGSSAAEKTASPEAAPTAVVTAPGSATAEKSVGPPADSGRGVSARPPTVSPGIALRHWFVHVWPAVSLGPIGRALVGRAFAALGLGSLTAPRLFVGLLPAISGFQPTAIRSPHIGVLAEEDASKDDEPSGGPSVGPIHSNPETAAFVMLAGLMALAVLAFGSGFPVFRRYRRW
jgi:hypothetical protein